MERRKWHSYHWFTWFSDGRKLLKPSIGNKAIDKHLTTDTPVATEENTQTEQQVNAESEITREFCRVLLSSICRRHIKNNRESAESCWLWYQQDSALLSPIDKYHPILYAELTKLGSVRIHRAHTYKCFSQKKYQSLIIYIKPNVIYLTFRWFYRMRLLEK